MNITGRGLQAKAAHGPRWAYTIVKYCLQHYVVVT